MKVKIEFDQMVMQVRRQLVHILLALCITHPGSEGTGMDAACTRLHYLQKRVVVYIHLSP
jgi:hypothetical protein